MRGLVGRRAGDVAPVETWHNRAVLVALAKLAGLTDLLTSVAILTRSIHLLFGIVRLLASAVALVVPHFHHLRSVPAYLLAIARTDPPSMPTRPKLPSPRLAGQLRAARRA